MMNNEYENKIDDQIEENSNHPSWSNVSDKKVMIWYLDKRLWLVIGAIVVFILMMLLSPHKHNKQVDNHHAVVMQSDNGVLDKNLQKLSTMKNDPALKAQPTSNDHLFDSNSFLLRSDQQNTQKALMARQNAPTSMFSAGGSIGGFSNNRAAQNTAQNTAASDNGKTFAGQGVYTDFGNQSMTATAVSAKKIAHPDYTVASGEFLHAVLETAIQSDLPGQIRAVVSQPVYAYVGETPLIPAGSRLIGQYSSSVLQGQNRVFVVWNRVILPNGTSAQINSAGTDQLGIAGQGAA